MTPADPHSTNMTQHQHYETNLMLTITIYLNQPGTPQNAGMIEPPAIFMKYLITYKICYKIIAIFLFTYVAQLEKASQSQGWVRGK